jgi:hypothetical protein
MLASYVLPRLQSTEVVVKKDPEDLKFQQEMQTKLDGIRKEMAGARQIVYVQEGEIVNGDPSLGETVGAGLLVPDQDYGQERLLPEQDYQGGDAGAGEDGPLLPLQVSPGLQPTGDPDPDSP